MTLEEWNELTDEEREVKWEEFEKFVVEWFPEYFGTAWKESHEEPNDGTT